MGLLSPASFVPLPSAPVPIGSGCRGALIRNAGQPLLRVGSVLPISLQRETPRGMQRNTYRGADVSGVADRAYEYCQDRRVRSLKVRGISCGGCGGQGSYTYGWALELARAAATPNESHIRVHIQLPHEESVESVRRILIFNAYGEKLVDARCVQESPSSPELCWVYGAGYGTDGEEEWCLRHRYWPSALGAFDPGGVLGCLDGVAPPFEGEGGVQDYQASATTGRHDEYRYTWVYPQGGGDTTFALKTLLGEGSDPAAAAPMYAVTTAIRAADPYRKRALPLEISEYEGENLPHTTVFQYLQWHEEDPLAFSQYTKTYPEVSQAKNGSGSSTSETFGEDRFGMLCWRMDAAGRIEYREYDMVTWELSTLIQDACLEPPWGGQPPSNTIHAVTAYAYDPLGRLVRTESPGGLADDNGTELRRVERRVYARLGGPTGKLSADRLAVLVYPHVENDGGSGQATPKGEVSITVSTPGGRTHAVASAFLPPGTAPYFYVGHWEWGGTPAQTLHAIFQPRADCHLLERREYTYSYLGSDGPLEIRENVWTVPESSVSNSYYRTTRTHNGLGLLWRVEGPQTSWAPGISSFRELQLTSYDALGRPVAWSVGSETAGTIVVRRVAYDGGEPGGALVVGDGHLTCSVEYLGDASPPRVTRYEYDFRGLMKSAWEGYDPGTGTAVLVRVYERDYRGRVVEEASRVGTEEGTLRRPSTTSAVGSTRRRPTG